VKYVGSWLKGGENGIKGKVDKVAKKFFLPSTMAVAWEKRGGGGETKRRRKGRKKTAKSSLKIGQAGGNKYNRTGTI